MSIRIDKKVHTPLLFEGNPTPLRNVEFTIQRGEVEDGPVA
ncbi:MAG: hypothetical protein WBK94_10480 [Tenuifilaceae bacterium]|jgi:hypothetical protein